MTGPDIDGYSALGAQFSAGGGLGHAAQITNCFSVLAANKGDIEMGCWALRRGQKSGEIDETTTCDGGLDIYTYRGMDAVEASPTASVGQLMATTAAHVWVWKPRLWRRLCDPLMVMVTLVTVSSTRRNPASRRYRRKQTPWE
nr:uncharacterized protein LOC118877446 isoform X2 [Drosophila suzukii]